MSKADIGDANDDPEERGASEIQGESQTTEGRKLNPFNKERNPLPLFDRGSFDAVLARPSNLPLTGRFRS